jgi:hypothetical protein
MYTCLFDIHGGAYHIVILLFHDYRNISIVLYDINLFFCNNIHYYLREDFGDFLLTFISLTMTYSVRPRNYVILGFKICPTNCVVLDHESCLKGGCRPTCRDESGTDIF